MRSWQKIVLSFSLTMVSFDSTAGTYLEPFIGVRFLGSEEFTSSGNKESFDRSGIYYGAKLRFDISKKFSLGGDFHLGKVKTEVQLASSGFANATYDTMALGYFISYRLKTFFNVWGTYYLKNEQTSTNASAPMGIGTIFSGSKYALGINYTKIKFIIINLEYSIFKFDTVESAGVIYRIPNNLLVYDTTNKGSEILLSISFPFKLSR